MKMSELTERDTFARPLTAQIRLAAAESARDAAESLIGEIREAMSRPGKKIEKVQLLLQEFSGDAELHDRMRRAQTVWNPHAGIERIAARIETRRATE